MDLKTYKKLNNFRFKESALVFLIKNNQVLLVMKKTGFGNGNWNGVSSRKHPKESIEQSAILGTLEEISAKPISISHRATLYSYLPHDPENHHKTYVYIVNKWLGKPKEYKETKLRWFNIYQIPTQNLGPYNGVWLSKLVNNEIFSVDYLYDKNNQIIEYKVTDNVK